MYVLVRDPLHVRLLSRVPVCMYWYGILRTCTYLHMYLCVCVGMGSSRHVLAFTCTYNIIMIVCVGMGSSGCEVAFMCIYIYYILWYRILQTDACIHVYLYYYNNIVQDPPEVH